MTADENTVTAVVDAGELAAFVFLARRCNTSQRQLGRHAVRQMLVAAKGGVFPDVPPLDPALARQSIKLWLQPPDMAELRQLANGHGSSPEGLGALAVRHMLAHASDGAVPMLPPPEWAPPMTALERYERGLIANLDDAQAENREFMKQNQAAINIIEAKMQLIDLDIAIAEASSDHSGESPRRT